MCNCMNKRMNGKRKFNTATAQNILLNNVLPGAGGFLVGEVLDRQLTLSTENPNLLNGGKVVAGVLLAVTQDGLIGAMGAGLALNGAVEFAKPILQKAGIAGVNLLPPGRNTVYVTGISDRQSMMPEEALPLQNIRVVTQ